MKNLIKLQTATIAARARTGDKSIATSVEGGMVRVESVRDDVVTTLTADMTVDQAVDFLNAI